MVLRDTLVEHLNDLLAVSRFRDYCPNGLQVEGRAEIRHIVTGVTASQALIDAAVDVGADMLLVHHGYFWKGEPTTIVGMRQRRIGSLLRADLNLVAYHLPLDAHPDLGNNARLGSLLGLEVTRPGDVERLVWCGELAPTLGLPQFAARVAQVLGRTPLVSDVRQQPVKRVAWCTGAAQDEIETAASMGADLFITGEVSERTILQSRELGIDFMAAGHHATERYGIKALGEHLAATFGVKVTFMDIDNPV